MDTHNLQTISQQLDSLKASVAAALAQVAQAQQSKEANAISSASKPPPAAAVVGLQRTESSRFIETSDDDAGNLRPTLYPHPPKPQKDGLEENKWGETEVMDALKLDSFQVRSIIASIFASA
jgi:hypothetical protein